MCEHTDGVAFDSRDGYPQGFSPRESAESLYPTPDMGVGGVSPVKPIRSLIRKVIYVLSSLPPDDPNELIVVLLAVIPHEVLTQI